MTTPIDRKSVEREWPIGFYAPGDYACTCVKCGQRHIADKRALHCADCTLLALRAALDAAETENKRLRRAALDATAHLVAATSLLRKGGKKAAPSNKMFEQMLLDYEATIKRARAALKENPDG